MQISIGGSKLSYQPNNRESERLHSMDPWNPFLIRQMNCLIKEVVGNK